MRMYDLKATLSGIFAFTILAILFCVITGCSQLKRIEQDIYGDLPAGHSVSFEVKSCISGPIINECVEGKGNTISETIDIWARMLTP